MVKIMAGNMLTVEPIGFDLETKPSPAGEVEATAGATPNEDDATDKHAITTDPFDAVFWGSSGTENDNDHDREEEGDKDADNEAEAEVESEDDDNDSDNDQLEDETEDDSEADGEEDDEPESDESESDESETSEPAPDPETSPPSAGLTTIPADDQPANELLDPPAELLHLDFEPVAETKTDREILAEQVAKAERAFLEASYRLQDLQAQASEIRTEIKDAKELAELLSAELRELREQQEQYEAQEVEHGLDLEQPGWWKQAPISLLSIETIGGLGPQKRQAIVAKVQTIGQLERARIQYGSLRHIPGIGLKGAVALEERLLDWLQRYQELRTNRLAEQDLVARGIGFRDFEAVEPVANSVATSQASIQPANIQPSAPIPSSPAGQPRAAAPKKTGKKKPGRKPKQTKAMKTAKPAKPSAPVVAGSSPAPIPTPSPSPDPQDPDQPLDIHRAVSLMRSSHQKTGDMALIPTDQSQWDDGYAAGFVAKPPETCRIQHDAGRLNWARGYVAAELARDGTDRNNGLDEQGNHGDQGNGPQPEGTGDGEAEN